MQSTNHNPGLPLATHVWHSVEGCLVWLSFCCRGALQKTAQVLYRTTRKSGSGRAETLRECVQVLATAKASADAGCDVTILGEVAAGDEDDLNVVSCEITAVGTDNNIMKDAVAEAVAEAAAYACDGKADAQIELAATVCPLGPLHRPLAPFKASNMWCCDKPMLALIQQQICQPAACICLSLLLAANSIIYRCGRSRARALVEGTACPGL